ncbi:hypothetical protein FQN54_008502 [Arachnomyces sp. PD_36]|nr:hypothetical protein FQN54_008502 [Arachnomyces sp. PD_36]
MLLSPLIHALLVGLACAHGNHGEQKPVSKEQQEDLLKKWGLDRPFSGISTFAHMKHTKCLIDPEELYDIAVIGAPFDTAVTYRPGARFGPRAIRAASGRQSPETSFNARAGINPYQSWAKILDCGDIPVTPLDNALAERQMYEAFLELGTRPVPNPRTDSASISSGKPKLVTLGGDHSIALPALRALYETYQKPITVLHFDAHLDTWSPSRYANYWSSEQSAFNHGGFFCIASREGLISNTTSAHAGLRTRLTGVDDGDYSNPGPEQGFLRIHADDIDDIGTKGIVDTIVNRIGLSPDQPVYLSIDIDVIDPGLAPGTGTPEPGGWTTREMIRILRGIENLNIVGADIVEVSPSYDSVAETTALAAAQIVFEVITSMVKSGVGEDLGGWYGRKEEGKGGEKDEL